MGNHSRISTRKATARKLAKEQNTAFKNRNRASFIQEMNLVYSGIGDLDLVCDIFGLRSYWEEVHNYKFLLQWRLAQFVSNIKYDNLIGPLGMSTLHITGAQKYIIKDIPKSIHQLLYGMIKAVILNDAAELTRLIECKTRIQQIRVDVSESDLFRKAKNFVIYEYGHEFRKSNQFDTLVEQVENTQSIQELDVVKQQLLSTFQTQFKMNLSSDEYSHITLSEDQINKMKDLIDRAKTNQYFNKIHLSILSGWTERYRLIPEYFYNESEINQGLITMFDQHIEQTVMSSSDSLNIAKHLICGLIYRYLHTNPIETIQQFILQVDNAYSIENLNDIKKNIFGQYYYDWDLDW